MDEIKPQSSVVKTNEILLKENGEWLHFAMPHHIMIAKKLTEVLPALRQIEQLVKGNGWYAAGFLSYEAASAFESGLQTHASTALLGEHSSLRPAPTNDFPHLWFGLYPRPRLVALPKPLQ